MKFENDDGEREHSLARRTGLILSLLGVALSLAACGGDGSSSAGSDGPVATTTTVTWDSPNEVWVDAARSAAAVDGSTSSSTLEVKLPANEAVKAVLASEVQLVNSPDQPTLEIAGQDDLVTGESGSIVICKLVVRKVDIEELVVENVQASRVTVVDFASEHGLDVEVDPVNVIRCGRGGVGVLALGVESAEDGDLVFDPTRDSIRVFATDGREGVRMNKVRILGPEGDDGFIETLVLNRSSVFGRVELRNLKVKELVIETVTVDH
jgi:hypothetical protein